MYTVNTISDLRALAAGSTPDVNVLGYHAPGDLGGGLFYWDSVSTEQDNGGTKIKPNSLTQADPGRWKRLFLDYLSVRWFGAKGDGTTDDTDAIQNTLDAVIVPGTGSAGNGYGHTVYIPPGNYKIEPQPGDPSAPEIRRPYALLITKNVMLVGSGGPPLGASRLILHGTGDGILIEQGTQLEKGYAARATIIKNLSLSSPSGFSGHDGIIVHAPFVLIQDCYVGGMARHGILIESRDTAIGFEGSTTLPPDSLVISNLWRVYNTVLDTNGGAGIRAHGSDTNGGLAVACYSLSNGVGFDDGTLGGATWIACYTEGAGVGFKSESAGAGTFLGCWTETTKDDFTQPNSLAVGGSLAGSARGTSGQRLGLLRSRITFDTVAGEADPLFGATVPALGMGPLEFWRTVPNDYVTWSLAYEASAATGEMSKSYQWYLRHQDPNATNPDNDVAGAPFGWTDSGHPRGAALPFIANPLINTRRRWSWKQPGVVLNPGSNLIYLNGNSFDPNNDTTYAQNPGQAYPPTRPNPIYRFADTRVTIDVELNQDNIATADIRVGAHAFSTTPHPVDGSRNIAVKIYNDGAAPVTATLVWHFEAFVTRNPGGIG
jgi:Pectate lyase superfamily protein